MTGCGSATYYKPEGIKAPHEPCPGLLMSLVADRPHGKRENTVNEAKKGTAYPRRIDVRGHPSDDTFLKLFNTSSDLITISDLKNGTLLDANESFHRISGYHRDAVIGRSLSDMGLWQPATNWARLAETLQRGPVRNVEVTFLTRAGERRTGLMSALPIHLRDEQSLLTVVEDTTEGRQ